MPIGILFWVLMILWLLFGAWVYYPSGWQVVGWSALLWVLLALLGWQQFGPPLRKG